METAINLWLWRYRHPGRYEGGYHLRADEAACTALSARLKTPGFIKASFALRQVPQGMPRILQTKDARFLAFDRLRIMRDVEAETSSRFEESGQYLNMTCTDAGLAEFSKALQRMCAGEWDFGSGEIMYWGLLSPADSERRYGPKASLP